ncbi:hypothetical protein ACFL09_02135 [Planctomycetota bacterium]
MQGQPSPGIEEVEDEDEDDEEVEDEDGKTRMIYVSKDRLAEVRAAVAAYRRLKDGLADLARRDLERWRRRTRRPRP